MHKTRIKRDLKVLVPSDNHCDAEVSVCSLSIDEIVEVLETNYKLITFLSVGDKLFPIALEG